MIDPIFMIAATAIVGISIVAFALLRGWQGWLEFKRSELEQRARTGARTGNASRAADEIEGGAMAGAGPGTARIEIADLKERIRKLEAIASGVEL